MCGLEASCDVSSASIRIDLATPRVAHVNRGCCLQMVPRGSNAHYFSIQASPAPTSPPEFFLHSHMHNIATAGGPPDWPTESPETDGHAEPSIVNRLHRLHRMLQRTKFCLLGLRTYWRTSAAEILLRNATLAALVAAQSRGYSQALLTATRAGNHRVV